MVVTTHVRWAVVGCGWVASDYIIPAIADSLNGKVVALCDVSADAVRNALQGAMKHAFDDASDRTFDVALDNDVVTHAMVERDPMPIYSFTSLDELLRFGEFDAVYIATPNVYHAEIAVACAQSGKHVLCEKPMATCVTDARRMVDACLSANVSYATAYDQRYHPAHVALRACVARGDLGVITQARIHYACWLAPDWHADNWRIDPALAGGGAVLDLAPHAIDLLESVLGDTWTTLVALTQHRVHSYVVDDGAVLAGRFASDALGLLQVAYNCSETYPRRTLEVIGTRAHALAIDTMGQTPGGRLTLTLAKTGETLGIPFDHQRSPFIGTVETFSENILNHRVDTNSGQSDLRLFALLEQATCH